MFSVVGFRSVLVISAVGLLVCAGCGNLADLGDPEKARARRLCEPFMTDDMFDLYVQTCERDFERGWSEAEQLDVAWGVCWEATLTDLVDDCTVCCAAVIQMVAARQ